MIEITILDGHTKIETNDLNMYIEGDFELKKEGTEVPTINVIAGNQQ